MATIADLLIQIGADSSGLKNELEKSKSSIDKTFSVNPVNQFADSVDGASGKLTGLIGNFTKLAGLAATGFGLTAVIDGAVNAGESIYQLSQQYNMATSEAVQLGNIMKLTGGDVDTAAKAFLRMDKQMLSGSAEGQKAQAVMGLYGVSLQDATGKLLPLNEQLANLAKGYNLARQRGEGQEFIMNTLGVRGMALTKTLLNYADAADHASKIKGISLDVDQMHEAYMQMQELQIQAGKLGTVAGAALTPVAMELLPSIMDHLSATATWINKNKELVSSLIVEVTRFIAVYEGLKLAGSAVRTGVGAYNTLKDLLGSGKDTAMDELTKQQERQINKSIAASDAMYAKMRREAIKTANQQNMSAEETQLFLSKKFAEIGIAAEQSANAIRASMTERFLQVRAVAEENAAVINGTLRETAAAAQVTADAQIAANERVAVSEASVGVAAREASAAKAEAAAASIALNEEVIASNELVGASGQQAGAETALGNAAAVAGLNNTKTAAGELAAAHAVTGANGVAAAVKTESAVSRLPAVLGKVGDALLLLTGGWLGVAAATVYALYKLYDYQSAYDASVAKHKYDFGGKQYGVDQNGNVVYTNSNDALAADPMGLGLSIDSATQAGVLEQYNNQLADEEAARKEKEKQDRIASMKEMSEEMKAAMADMPSIADMMGSAGGSGGGGGRASASAKEPAYDVRQGALYNAGQWSGLPYGTGDGQVVCTTYIENAWSDAGVTNAHSLSDWAPNWSSTAGSAFHALDSYGNGNYTPQPGDAIITNDGAHVIMVGATGSDYWAAGGWKKQSDHYDQDWRDAFSGNIVGAVSLTEFAGVSGSSGSSNNEYQALMRRQKEITDAKKKLSDLVAAMQAGITSDTAPAYEAGMAKVAADVKKKADELRAIKNAGVDTASAEGLLKQYQAAEMQKVTDAWKQKWDKLAADTKAVQATMAGDFQALADAEYETTVQSLDKEKAERLKDVARNRDDLQAKAAVEEWYASKVVEAQAKATAARQEAFDKSVQYEIDHGSGAGLVQLLQSQQAQESKAWEGRKKSLQSFYQLWDEANVNIDKTMAETATSFASGLSSIFMSLGSDIKNAGDLAVSVGKLILNELAQVAAKAIAARIALNSFGGSLSGSSSGSGFTSFLGTVASGLLGGSSGSAYSNPISGMYGSSSGLLMDFSGLHLATGGVVTAPSLAMVGEGSDHEAVMPLNSQTYAGLAQGIVGSLLRGSGGKGAGAPVVNITNNSNAQVGVEGAHWDDELENYVLNVVVQGVQTNKGGTGSALKQLLK